MWWLARRAGPASGGQAARQGACGARDGGSPRSVGRAPQGPSRGYPICDGFETLQAKPILDGCFFVHLICEGAGKPLEIALIAALWHSFKMLRVSFQ